VTTTHSPRPPASTARLVLASIASAAVAAVLLAGCGSAAERPVIPAAAPAAATDKAHVGQGDATLIRHGGASVLVDTGPPGGPIVDRLREAGVDGLDLLVCTHDAADHDGAASEVLDALPVGLVLDGEELMPRASIARLARARGVRRLASDAGQTLRIGPLELRVLWPARAPPAPAGADPNDRATVLHVRDGDFDLLLAADAESDVLAALDLPAVEALKVSHHGSADPGLPGLLARLTPWVAVIPVGRHNSYGHPAPATLVALAGVPVVRRTDRDGTVRVRVDDGRMTVTTGD